MEANAALTFSESFSQQRNLDSPTHEVQAVLLLWTITKTGVHINTLLQNVSKLAWLPSDFQVMTGWDKVSHRRVRPLGGEQRRSKKTTIVTVGGGGFEIQRNAVEQSMPAKNSFTTTLKQVQCREIWKYYCQSQRKPLSEREVMHASVSGVTCSNISTLFTFNPHRQWLKCSGAFSGVLQSWHTFFFFF